MNSQKDEVEVEVVAEEAELLGSPTLPREVLPPLLFSALLLFLLLFRSYNVQCF